MKQLVNNHELELPNKNLLADIEKRLNLSYNLLKNRSLLTPHLTKSFGNISVSEIDASEGTNINETYFRESIIKQQCTGNQLLEANLRIIKNNIPYRIVEDLKNTSEAFGSLLLKYNIDVEIRNLNITIHKNLDNSKLRMGRTLTIVDRVTEEAVCFVRELMVDESELVKAKAYFLGTVED